MKQAEIKNRIPPDWIEIELGKLVDEKRPVSYGIVQTGELVEGGIPCIRVTDITNGKIDTSNLITTSQKISDGYKRTLLKKGDLVMALRGKIGQIAKIDDELVGANLTRGVALIALKDDYCSDFVLQQISSDRTIKVFERSLNGSALQELSIGIVRKIPIILPKSLTEQQSIARILKSCDQVIETTEKLIAQKELRKKWLMQQLLSGQRRLPGFKGDRNLKVIGVYLREVSERNKDLKVSRVLSVTNSRGFINQSEQFDRSVASEDATNYKIVRKGQFAYNPSRVNVGSLDLLRDFEEGILSPMYIVFSTDEKYLLSSFLYFQLKTKWFYGHIPMFVQGSVRDSLSFDGLCSIKFFIPSIEEQKAIAQVLQSANFEIFLLKMKVEKLKEKKKGLMQQLLSGNIRIK
ncbi:MAG: restriction endonuclease subunit S [Cytophagales bacterium]|nr:restriction endonuclease subunit S [Cytophagales bacterium]MCA6390738.1 restriction endonuclease subunit S [Cytophagales bacterium]MCA6396979.1 restriction endonuclease subunit S [Cytophagales bacterium]MCA6403934.1 restriction endonuclease subunit S [Cytophagales bacterium]MCA6405816.1 restriction endonuclease subunit S [Cytophagales bacterium]